MIAPARVWVSSSSSPSLVARPTILGSPGARSRAGPSPWRCPSPAGSSRRRPSITFLGFRSRCRTPWLCAYATVWQSERKIWSRRKCSTSRAAAVGPRVVVLDDLLERSALHELHHVERLALLVGAGLVHRDDPRVLELAVTLASTRKRSVWSGRWPSIRFAPPGGRSRGSSAIQISPIRRRRGTLQGVRPAPGRSSGRIRCRSRPRPPHGPRPSIAVPTSPRRSRSYLRPHADGDRGVRVNRRRRGAGRHAPRLADKHPSGIAGGWSGAAMLRPGASVLEAWVAWGM